jgi:hypothetical protein
VPERFEAALKAQRIWADSLPPDEARAVEAAIRRAEFSWSLEDLRRVLQSKPATRP